LASFDNPASRVAPTEASQSMPPDGLPVRASRSLPNLSALSQSPAEDITTISRDIPPPEGSTAQALQGATSAEASENRIDFSRALQTLHSEIPHLKTLNSEMEKTRSHALALHSTLKAIISSPTSTLDSITLSSAEKSSIQRLEAYITDTTNVTSEIKVLSSISGNENDSRPRSLMRMFNKIAPNKAGSTMIAAMVLKNVAWYIPQTVFPSAAVNFLDVSSMASLIAKRSSLGIVLALTMEYMLSTLAQRMQRKNNSSLNNLQGTAQFADMASSIAIMELVSKFITKEHISIADAVSFVIPAVGGAVQSEPDP
jgi:hypothetical protein